MASTKMEIVIKDWPEALFIIRMELGRLLRSEAETESDPRFARRLNELAAIFESGQTGEATE